MKRDDDGPAHSDVADSVLVTGGTGFVGSHLVRRLAETGRRVHLLMRAGSSLWRLEDVAPRVTLWQGDLMDLASMKRCMLGSRPGIVFHLAGSTAGRRWTEDMGVVDASIDVNLRGTMALMRALQETDSPVRRVIRTGSLFEYGLGPLPFDEGQRELPVSPYSASQVATMAFLQAAIRSGIRLPVVTLRLGWVYGPGGPPEFFVASLIMHCLEGRDFGMTNGEQKRDLVYVEDVVDACLMASTTECPAGEIINIGGGRAYPLREVAEMILQKTGTGVSLNIGALPERVGDVGDAYCDNGKAKRVLGWSPRTTLDDGLDRTIAWYSEHRNRMRKRAVTGS
jgi:nucleoside-diphosphate-sugar epimerase